MKRLSLATSIACLLCVAAVHRANADNVLMLAARKTAEVLDCDCRALGRNWRQGEKTCVAGTLRVCGMDQNVSSWIATEELCPLARHALPNMTAFPQN